MPAKTISPPIDTTHLSVQEVELVRQCVEMPQYWDQAALHDTMRVFKANHPFLIQERADHKANPSSWFSETRLFEEAEHLLQAAGFIKFHQQIGPRIDSQRMEYSEFREDIHQWWAHPSGVLASADSCGSTDGHFRYNNIGIYAQIDLGVGRSLTWLGTNQVKGSSGGKAFHPEGNWVYKTWTQCPRSPLELIDFLHGIQQAGRLVPFDQWDVRQGPMSYLHDWLPANDPAALPELVRQWKQQDPALTDKQAAHRIQHGPDARIIAHNMCQATWDHIMTTLPTFDQVLPGLSSVMALSSYRLLGLDHSKDDEEISWGALMKEEGIKRGVVYGARRDIEGPFLPPPITLDSNRIDASHTLVQRLAAASLIRYPSHQEGQLLKSWLELCASLPMHPRSFDERLDPLTGSLPATPTNINWNMVDHTSISELSVTLPALLLEDGAQHSSSLIAFCELMNHATSEQVEHWCTTPDQEGLTLPMRALKVCAGVSVIGNMVNEVHHVLPEVLTAIHQKCPATSWVMDTSKASVDGLWFGATVEKGKYEKSLPFEQWEEIVNQVKILGAPVSNTIKWFTALASSTLNAHGADILQPSIVHHHANLQEALDAHPEVPITPHMSKRILETHTTDMAEQKVQGKRLKI